MKRSNLLLGASAFILAIAAAFDTKVSKSTHSVASYGTQGIAHAHACVRHSVQLNSVTTFTTVGTTKFVAAGTITVFTRLCNNTLFVIDE